MRVAEISRDGVLTEKEVLPWLAASLKN